MSDPVCQSGPGSTQRSSSAARLQGGLVGKTSESSRILRRPAAQRFGREYRATNHTHCASSYHTGHSRIQRR
ncbi:hypothetical protein CSUI_005365 [Cystoisospora suis]|uniref:Uncharacterized protein n=1 Tax=Cystoisospora suis TaxID=483139 RepID=A0A2C6KXC5_9APIC|nr:hypothetical protein CSUI_005365 [Cystoisospora suis]